ncbi:MAG: hypothetical protein D6791_08240 [Chloroflexi bacterium]|nr:MAG: hypothetical protein D6791_08240 [Chloroflexota bacterium]
MNRYLSFFRRVSIATLRPRLLVLTVVSALFLFLLPRPFAAAAPQATPTPPPSPPRQQLLEELGMAQAGVASVQAEIPQMQSSPLSGRVGAIQLDGDRLYVGLAQNFAIFDVADPSAPRLVNQVPLGASARHITLYEGMAYVGVSYFGTPVSLYTLDLHNDSGRIIARWQLPSQSILRQQGTTVYLLSTQGNLSIWDLAKPGAPRKRFEKQNFLPGYLMHDAELQGTMLYVLSDSALSIVDVSNPAGPVVRNSLPLQGIQNGLTVQGSWVYAQSMDGLFYVIDAGQPDHLQVRASFRRGVNPYDFASVAQGGRLLIFQRDFLQDSLDVYDISEPAQITLLGTTKLQSLLSDYETVPVFANGLIFRGSEKGLMIERLEEPVALVQAGSYLYPLSPADVVRAGPGRLFTVEKGLVTLLDVHRPQEPVVLWAEASDDNWQRVIAGDRYLVLSAEGFRDHLGWHDPAVTIYERRVADSPRFVRRLPGLFNAQAGFAVKDNLLIGVSRDQKTLKILDMSKPGAPTFVFDGSLAGEALAVISLHEDALFVRGQGTDGLWYLYQYDVRDPTHPRLVASYHRNDNAYALDMVFYKDIAYVSVRKRESWTQVYFVVVLRVHPLQAPQELDTYRPPNMGLSGFRVQIVNRWLLFNNGTNILWADISTPEHPRSWKLTEAQGRLMVVMEPYVFSLHNSSLYAWYLPRIESKMLMVPDAQVAARTYAVQSWRNDLLVGHGNRLEVWQVGGAHGPEQVGRSPLLARQVMGIDAEGDMAYVALGDGGVQAVDLSDRTRPRPMGRFPAYTFTWGVAVSGKYVVMADSGGFATLDGSNPYGLRQIAHEQYLPAFAASVVNERVALAGPHRLTIGDMPEPTSPDTAGTALVWTESVGNDGRLFYAVRGFDGLATYNPDYSGELVPATTYSLPGYSFDVETAGHRVYVLDWLGGLHHLDLTDLRNPSPPIETVSFPARAWDVASGTDSVLVSLPTMGVAVLSPRDLDAGTMISHTAISTEHLWPVDERRVVAATGSAVYVLDLDSGDTGPSFPHIPVSGRVTGLSGSGSVYYAGTADGHVHVLHLDDRGGLSELAVLAAGGSVRSILASSSYLYLLVGESKLAVFDITVPEQPAALAGYDAQVGLSALAATGDVVYLGVDGVGLEVLRLQGPSQLQLVQILPWAGTVEHLATDGRYLVAYGGSHDLEIFELASPAQPRFLYASSYDGPVDRMALFGGVLTLVGQGRMVRYRLSTLSHTLASLTAALATGVRDVFDLGDTLLIATATDGVQRFRTHTLWNPLMMAMSPTR